MTTESIDRIPAFRLLWRAPVPYEVATLKYIKSRGLTPNPETTKQIASLMMETMANAVKTAHNRALLMEQGRCQTALRIDYMKGYPFGLSDQYSWIGKMLYELEFAGIGTLDQKYAEDGTRYTFLDYSVDHSLSPVGCDHTNADVPQNRWRVAIIDELHEKDETHPTAYQVATLSLIDINSVEFKEE